MTTTSVPKPPRFQAALTLVPNNNVQYFVLRDNSTNLDYPFTSLTNVKRGASHIEMNRHPHLVSSPARVNAYGIVEDDLAAL
jgi:hypothetical protein